MAFDFFLILRFIFIGVCFLMTAIGCSQWQFGNDAGYRYYFFGFQHGSDPWRVKLKEVQCVSFRNAMQAAYAFSIIACIAMGLALICLVILLFATCVKGLQEYAGPIRAVSLVATIIAFCSLTIAWPVSESCRSQRKCGNEFSLKDQGYGISRGLALLIAAWVILIFEMISAVISLARGVGGSSSPASSAPPPPKAPDAAEG